MARQWVRANALAELVSQRPWSVVQRGSLGADAAAAEAEAALAAAGRTSGPRWPQACNRETSKPAATMPVQEPAWCRLRFKPMSCKGVCGVATTLRL